MVDVIIPLYNCVDTLEYTLMSLSIQNNRDKINVVLVDDCSLESYDSIINKFKNIINIKYYKLDKNMGPGVARQYGIDHSNNPYIMFIDADDLLFYIDSIDILYNAINGGYDYIYSSTYNEFIKTIFSNDGDLHGKIYRRSFIKEKKISFNDSRFHEDNLFNSLIIINNPKKKKIVNTTYIYSYNKNSITKKDTDREFERLEVYIKNMKYVLEKAHSNNCLESLMKQYLDTKYKFLENVYQNISDEEKIVLNEWLEKYNFDVISF